MHYPQLFNAVYCEPLCIDRSMFQSIHAVLWPRIMRGHALEGLEVAAAAAPKQKPGVNAFNGRRATKCAPATEWNAAGQLIVTDDRFYYTAEGKPEVAVVPIYGILAKNAGWIEQACMGVTDINAIGHALHQASEARDVKTIVLDVASPGGQVTGIRELAASVKMATQKRGKRVYAFTDERMASAAYWIASQADEIYNTPTATIGSIGTYLAWLDESVKMSLEGVKLEFFGAGEHKGMGLPGKALSQKDRELLQARVDEINGWFTSSVTESRPRIATSTMQGQVFTGEKSPGLHLSDGICNSWHEFLELL
jgi:signal peptide peptidase SppA